MATAVTVGELNAILSLTDDLTPQLAQAERRAQRTTERMDAKVKLDADTSGLDAKLRGAEGDWSRSVDKMSKDAPKLDGSKIGDGVRGGLDDVAGELTTRGGEMGGLLTAGMAGALGIGAGLLIDELGKGFERKGDSARLGIKLGLGPEWAGPLGSIAGGIYAQGFGDSLGDVNSAISDLTTQMGGLGTMSRDEFDSLIRQALAFKDAGAELSGQDGVFAAAGTMIRNGLAKDGKEAFDILAKGMKMPKADDLLATFSEYSPIFQSLGLDAKTSLGLMGQAIEGGARNTDLAADSLKTFLDRAKSGAPDAMTAFQTLGLDAGDMHAKIAAGGPAAAEALNTTMERLRGIEDPATKATTATQLFGDQGVDMQNSLLAFDPSQAVTRLGDVQGAAKKVEDQFASVTGPESWRRNMESNVNDFIDNSAIPALGKLADKYHEIFGENSGDSLRAGAAKLGDSNWWGDWGAQGVVDGAIGPLGTIAKNIFGFDSGGVVPGPKGSPTLALVHGGEMVLPTHRMGVGAGLAAAAGQTVSTTNSGGNQYFTIHVANPSPPAAAREIIYEVRKRKRLGR